MDFQSSSGYSVSSSNIDMWGWQEEGFCLPRDSQLGLPQCLWGDNNQKDESLLSTLGDQTPIKDCRDLGLDVMHTSDKAKKVVEEGQEASRGKRRRILQFTSDADGTTADNEQLSAPVTISKEDSMVVDGCPKDSQYNPICSSDDVLLFSNEVLDQSSDEWLEYFNDSEISSSQNDHAKSIAQVNVSDFCNMEPDTTTNLMLEMPNAATPKISKGTESCINSPTKLTTFVAYPFTLIKPCQLQGHLTLNDINQRIHAPPSSRSRDKKDDKPTFVYPTKLTTSVAYPFTLVRPCQVQGHLTLNDINQRIHAPSPSRSRNKKDE
ncbi:protein XRI1-like isoform X2 [Musa acuminata AAA Group]|uniref:protein XRI1-like isoform X2 n=1 Tax=Musa acuminata AAA Group TaxID=214697 RepID=UPI0031DA7034